ncbi:MAG: Ig domain-containing protein, partial [Clostridiaceae bacterium]|nr:Ig domain-containing protein [Clostridiaceae bacterium]
AFGRITALSVGETKITVSVDGINKSFDLKVEENDEYPIEDIDIGKYEDEMETGKSQKLSVTLLPSNAKESTVKYSSSDPKIASIDSSGEIKALEKGSTVITVKAGDITKEIKIRVVTKTEKIEINKTYLVLKAGEQFELECKVMPKEANQKIDYKSTNSSVAKVDNKGLITALKTGEATIIVSNGYNQSLTTVIVNKEMVIVEDAVVPASGNVHEEELLLKLLKEAGGTVTISKNELLLVSRPVLKYLYESKGTLVVDGENYKITIDGKDIENYENELLTEIVCEEEENGIRMLLNDNHNLPGNISISFEDARAKKAKHLYLYNETKKKYELISNSLANGTMKIDVAGKYLLAERKLSFLSINILLIAAACFCLLAVVAAYIFTKKKHWFW